MSLDYVKSLTGDNPQVEVIYNHIAERLLHRIKDTEVPLELEYIVDEATIRRFNRIGSEGMKSESVEGMRSRLNWNTLSMKQPFSG